MRKKTVNLHDLRIPQLRNHRVRWSEVLQMENSFRQEKLAIQNDLNVLLFNEVNPITIVPISMVVPSP